VLGSSVVNLFKSNSLDFNSTDDMVVLGILKSAGHSNPALIPFMIPSFSILINTGKKSTSISVKILIKSHLALSFSLGFILLSLHTIPNKSNKYGIKLNDLDFTESILDTNLFLGKSPKTSVNDICCTILFLSSIKPIFNLLFYYQTCLLINPCLLGHRFRVSSYPHF